MDKIIVHGGHSLTGTVKISGSKNSALPILAATLLTNDSCVIQRVPDLSDVHYMLQILAHLGAEVERASGVVTVKAEQVNSVAPYEIVRKMRASVCVSGPLLGREKEATVSLPGGCVIGDRPIDLHLRGFEALGAAVRVHRGNVKVFAPSLLSTAGGESSVTEDIFPQRFMHVSELKRMGATIEMDGATAKLRGVDNLSGAPVMASDLRASAALVLAGLLADGKTEINRVYHIDRGYEMIDQKLGELGAHIERVNGIRRGVSLLSLHKEIERPIPRSYLCPGMLRATELNREPEKNALML